jgi:glycosyltransferase involved in cell wall biosynthesis
MRRAAASGLAIAFDGRQLSRDGLLRMIAEADCYVSLHRAEGFGYTMAEAMLYGVPVIASGYSGNLEYMTAKNSFLVPCKEAYVKAADGPFQRGSIWGEPDLDVAADLMRRAAEDRATFREVGKRGQETVIQALGANSIAETIRPFFDATQATSTVRADGGGATGEDGQSGVVSRRGDAKPTVRSGRRRVLQ